MPELTPFEQDLLDDPGAQRGYAPRDGAVEPETGPTDAAGASQPAESDQGPT